MKDFFEFETPYDSEDYKLMKNVVNMGIDSHLEGFTKSEFKKSPHFNNKFLWNIHNSELPILYRRLADLYDKTGNEDYDDLSSEIQKFADTTNTAIATGEFGEGDLEEMIDPYDPMDLNQTIDGQPTSTSDLSMGGADTAPAYSEHPAAEDQGIENYIDDDTKSQELVAEMEIDEAELREMIRRQFTQENLSDSLANQHGENLKPATMVDEDSQMKRHQAGQREKTVPLGQHAPHSQVAKK